MAGAGKVRVVAGSAGGLWLKVPKDFASRPTQDRVKQAIFSILGARVIEANVLDLFAGTGALGIEALSRGASSCVFVESNRSAVKTLRENLTWCKLDGMIEPIDVTRYLQTTPRTFDLVLADPPYSPGQKNLEAEPWFQALAPRLAPNGLLVWEHHRLSHFKALTGWTPLRTTTHGDTTITLLSPL
jgi:16S rRNA (guanine(966)-N(2))-methyltransferase RsmD